MAESERVIVDIDDFQFSIWGVEEANEEFTTELADFVRELGFVVVHAGQHYGPAELVVRRRDAPGPLVDDMDEVVEVSVASDGPLQVAELYGVPIITLAETAGSYRLRISARGRAAGYEQYAVEDEAELVEHYLIELWPAPPAPAQTLRQRTR